jgi:hypothetical protein
VNARIFGTGANTLNAAYLQSSRNQVSFYGQVVGPFNINYSSTGACDYSGWASAANTAAKAAGIDITQYQRLNYVIPGNSNCGWSGLAYMPGTQSWVQACSSTGIFAHELGHNLSLHHAGSPTAEYGDGSDPMGGARLLQFNSANRTLASWQPAGTVKDVAYSGSFLVDALELAAPVNVQVLRLPKTDTGETYYVSFRQALNQDAGLPSPYVNAVSIHRAAGSTLPTKTVLQQNLAAGQTFTDSANGIQITLQSIAANTASISVAWSGPTCSRLAPSMTVSPTSQTTGPNLATQYTVSLKNNNSNICGTSNFALSTVLPSGVTGSLSTSTLSVNAGSTASFTLTATPSSAVLDGSYTLNVSGQESGGVQTTTHAGLIVYRDSIAPTVSITNPANNAILSTRTVTISAAASDASGIKSVTFYIDGVLVATSTTAPYSTTVNLRKLSNGTHRFMARATDKLGNSASQEITVTVK